MNDLTPIDKKTDMKKYCLPTKNTKAATVILADGGYPAEGSIAAAILADAGYVVCCDGAADAFISRGGVPAAIVGDCDSVSRETAERYALLVHRDPDQETNDLTKAFRYCLGQGRRDIVILGATGRREDHTIGNVSLLADYAREAEVRMITDNGIFDAVREPSLFDSFEGQQVSLFSIGKPAPVSASGLCYPLPPGGFTSWWQGTLNKSLGDCFSIDTNETVIVFRAFRQFR